MTRVLLVDDDAFQREVVAELLEHHGHHVIKDAQGQPGLRDGRAAQQWLTDALACTQDWHGFVLVTDGQMPRMDGPALIAWVRSQPALAEVRVVLMTGLPERARGLGVPVIDKGDLLHWRTRLLRTVGGEK